MFFKNLRSQVNYNERSQINKRTRNRKSITFDSKLKVNVIIDETNAKTRGKP